MKKKIIKNETRSIQRLQLSRHMFSGPSGLISDPQGPPGSFDFLLLLMADIRNDIAQLQDKVYGRAVPFPGLEDGAPAVPDSWRVGPPDGPPDGPLDGHNSGETGSGDDYRDRRPWAGTGPKKSRKRKMIRRSDWTN